MTPALVDRVKAFYERFGFRLGGADAALLNDVLRSLDIAKGPRLAKQTRLGLSLLDRSTSWTT